MKKKIKWGLVLCSVLIPVCLSACKQGTIENKVLRIKKYRRKSIEKTFILTRQDLQQHLIGMQKNSIRYITFEKLPQYMRSDDSDGISIYGQQPNEAPHLRKEGFKKALQVVEGVYVDQSRIDTVIKANGAKNQEDMYTRLWNDYIIPKIEKTVVLLIQILMWNILVRSTPQNIWSHVFEAHDECIEFWKKI